MKPEIYIDMDNVIYNFLEVVVGRYNKAFRDNIPYQEVKSYWFDECTKAPREWFEWLLNQEGIFHEGKEIEGAIDTINKLIEEDYKVYIITSPQWDSKYGLNEKVLWLRENLPMFPIKNLFYGAKKSKLVGANRILFDDDPKNLVHWKKGGGTCICMKTGWNDEWKENKVNSWDGFYKRLKFIENNRMAKR